MLRTTKIILVAGEHANFGKKKYSLSLLIREQKPKNKRPEKEIIHHIIKRRNIALNCNG